MHVPLNCNPGRAAAGFLYQMCWVCLLLSLFWARVLAGVSVLGCALHLYTHGCDQGAPTTICDAVAPLALRVLSPHVSRVCISFCVCWHTAVSGDGRLRAMQV
jgi:hypothetical protein